MAEKNQAESQPLKDMSELFESWKQSFDESLSSLREEVGEIRESQRSSHRRGHKSDRRRSRSVSSSSSSCSCSSCQSRSRSRSRSKSSRRRSRTKKHKHSKSKKRSKSHSPLRKKSTWGERMDKSDEEASDGHEPERWPDSDEEPTLIEVSEKTKSLLQKKCVLSLTHDKRKTVKRRYPQPKVDATRTPKLDDFLKSTVSNATKTGDKDLAKIQTFVLDAMAPLTYLLEAIEQEKEITVDEVADATATAIELVANASARISRLRRERVCHQLNKTLQPLASKDTLYVDAPPALFGSEFAKKSKDHIDQIKAITASSARKPFFPENPSRRGGYVNRGYRGGRGSYSSQFHNRGRYQKRGFHPQNQSKSITTPQSGKNHQ